METGLKQQTIEEIVSLAREYEIEKVILFGSRARGDYRRTSDIDLAIKGGNTVRFALDVEEVVMTLLKFDIVDLDGAVQEELRQSIMEEGVAIYEKN